MHADKKTIRAHSWIVILIVFALRLPFLNQAIQGDDPYYLYGAEHAQIDPLHPAQAKYFFQGDMVDMRGFPHPPLNAWILAAPLAVLGDVREVQYHFRYILFSLIAALAALSLARRFCERPLIATLLFVAVPAFVVNGNSLESDLPFLAMWMAAIALFVKAVDEESGWALAGATFFAALAGLAAYQSVLLAPVLAAYLFDKRTFRWDLWIAVLAAPVALAGWQVFEYASSGALPAAMLAGYMKTYSLQSGSNKLRSATALIVHAGWILSPVVVFFLKGPRWTWIAAGAAGIAAAIYDPNPLFWISVAAGIALLTAFVSLGFLSAWILIFFAGAALVFFAGSARYLLPIAAPVAILAVQRVPRFVAITGFALQLTLGLGLAMVNQQHWDAYRTFAGSLKTPGRIWINAEWGLRWYLESRGGLPMPNGQMLQPGDTLVTSALALPLPVNAQLAPVAQMEIRPSIPLRIISLDGRSAYSSAGGRELLPFEISTGPIDRVQASMVVERTPTRISITPKDADQVISGLFPDGWMSAEAVVLLKRPEHGGKVTAGIYIPDASPARRLTLLADGAQIAEQSFAKPGAYSVEGVVAESAKPVTITLKVDQTFSVPGDLRKLGVIVTKIGF